MFPISGENSVECVKGFFMKKSYLYKVYLSHVKLTTNIKLRFFLFLLGNLQQSSDIFSNLWKSWPVFGNLR